MKTGNGFEKARMGEWQVLKKGKERKKCNSIITSKNFKIKKLINFKIYRLSNC